MAIGVADPFPQSRYALAHLMLSLGLAGVPLFAGSCGAAPPAPPSASGSTVAADSPRVSASASSGGLTKMTDLDACLQRRWLHSHEEDTADVRVYRPAEYPFPPARGRDGFEFALAASSFTSGSHAPMAPKNQVAAGPLRHRTGYGSMSTTSGSSP